MGSWTGTMLNGNVFKIVQPISDINYLDYYTATPTLLHIVNKYHPKKGAGIKSQARQK